MKSFNCVIICSVFILGFCQITTAGNKLVNPSFEEGSGKIKDGGAVGWTAFGSANSTVISNSVQAHSGTNFLSLFQNFSGGNNFSGVYQSFPTRKGHKWEFSGYLRNGRGADYLQEGNSAFLKVDLLQNGTIIESIENNTNGQGLDASSPTNDLWVFNSMHIDITNDPDTIRFVVIHSYIGTNYYGGSSSFDDLKVEWIPPAGMLYVIR